MPWQKLIRSSKSSPFKNSELAKSAFGKDKIVAGRIDYCEGGRIGGWMVDSRNVGKPPRVELVINGLVTQAAATVLHRQDIANLVGSDVNYGFEYDVRDYCDYEHSRVELQVRVQNDTEHTLGPVLLMIVDRTYGRYAKPNSAQSSGLSILESSSYTIEDKLEHIFSHITATFERSREYLEDISRALNTRAAFNTHNEAQGDRSAISGVGSFGNQVFDPGKEVCVITQTINEAVKRKIYDKK